MGQKYSISIATYVKRFDRFFKPLLKGIKEAQSEIEVIAVINGEHNQLFDQEYRREILQFISEYDNVYPIMLTEHRSCSKLWNTGLCNATNDMVLRIDDDVTISDDIFYEAIGELIEKTDGDCFKINGSWSHTVLNRRQIDKVGWFDERLLGGGEEDGDMEWRWSMEYGKEFLNISGLPIINHWDDMEFDDCLVGHRKVHGKRSMFNLEFIRQKYVDSPDGESHGIMCENNTRKVVCVNPTENQYPNESFYWDNKSKL